MIMLKKLVYFGLNTNDITLYVLYLHASMYGQSVSIEIPSVIGFEMNAHYSSTCITLKPHPQP